MVHDFITFGGVLFWIIVSIITLAIAAEINSEKVGTAVVTLVGTFAAIIAFTDVNTSVWPSLAAHPMYIIYGFLCYLALAVIWATIKWRVFYLPKIFDAYDEYRRSWLAQKGLKDMPADQQTRDAFSSAARSAGVDVSYTRMVRNNKARITTWMVFWFFSLIETFLGDFLQRVFASLYKAVAGLFQRMSDGMASKYSELN